MKLGYRKWIVSDPEITTEYWLTTFICHVVSSYVVKYAHLIPMFHLTSQNIVCYSKSKVSKKVRK